MKKTYSRIAAMMGLVLISTMPLSALAQVTDGDISPNVQLICSPEANLFQNAGFESPQVPDRSWNIFPDVTIDPNSKLGWLVNWVTPEESGILGLELQASVAGTPSEGRQLAELDGDHPTKISQAIVTIPGKSYEVTFDFSARPGTGVEDNLLKVTAGGNVLSDSIKADASNLRDTAWQHYTFQFVASSESTTIEFSDLGANNSLGSYLDNTNVHCAGDPIREIPPAPVTGGGGSSSSDYFGCTDRSSINFNSLANKDDGTCVLPKPTGEVLGASTTNEVMPPEDPLVGICKLHANEVLKYGDTNDVSTVSALQSYLNQTLHLSIYISGSYNTQTHRAVKKLQHDHANEILSPWASENDSAHGLKYWLLLTKCGELDLATPSM